MTGSKREKRESARNATDNPMVFASMWRMNGMHWATSAREVISSGGPHTDGIIFGLCGALFSRYRYYTGPGAPLYCTFYITRQGRGVRHVCMYVCMYRMYVPCRCYCYYSLLQYHTSRLYEAVKGALTFYLHGILYIIHTCHEYKRTSPGCHQTRARKSRRTFLRDALLPPPQFRARLGGKEREGGVTLHHSHRAFV